ncbi:MAG: LytTR family DNA-binding domain-containing protein [Bacteroidales bacterium]|jgi:DNA-binding LytR/AlgR family response regulator
MVLNCLIVDDEPLALNLIEGYVKKTPFLKLAGKCSNAVETLELLNNTIVDLLFLDIQMPQLNGIELSRMLKGDTMVIFTTAFEQYALEGFKVDAIDYLLKPISYAEFLKAAIKAQRWFNKTLEKGEARSIFIKTDYRMVQVELSNILYVEGEKDYIRIHTTNGGSLMTLMNIKSIEEYLPSETFLRVHRSFIVNLNQIKTIERNRIIFDKVHIPISDSYRDSVMEKINSRIIKK